MLFAQPHLGLVAAHDGLDVVPFGFEIVAQQQGERLLVLDDQDARSHAAPLQFQPGNGTVVRLVVSPFGRSSASARPSTM